MSTPRHPNTLAALAALAALQDAWQYLPDMIEPGTARRGTPRLGPAALAQLNRQTRDERADLTTTRHSGLAPRGASPAPLRLRVLEAQIAASDTTTDAAWTASSALRTRPMLGYIVPVGDDRTRFTAATNYLAVTIPLLTPDLAGSIGADLDGSARACRAATNSEPDRHSLKAPCPACGRISLVVTTYDTADAFVTCRQDCRCRGVDCLCRRPERMRSPGGKHVWLRGELEQLNRLLSRRPAA